MLEGMHKLMDEADVLVHYNGQKFDCRHLNAEFFDLKMDPPSPYKHLDLLKTTRQQFYYPSNKLDYVSQRHGIGHKIRHSGMQLWVDCMAGDDAAWQKMKRYNIQDVKLTEKYYKLILPWIKTHPNWGLYLAGDRPTCRNCGSTKVIRKGVEYTNTMTYKRYKCKDCGTHIRGRNRIRKAPEGILV